jgi:hypothetical protein
MQQLDEQKSLNRNLSAELKTISESQEEQLQAIAHSHHLKDRAAHAEETHRLSNQLSESQRACKHFQSLHREAERRNANATQRAKQLEGELHATQHKRQSLVEEASKSESQLRSQLEEVQQQLANLKKNRPVYLR